jgi:hypothetical protein
MGASWIPEAVGAASGIAGIIQGNQNKQKNKGLISQAYRQNVIQTNLQQANTRQDSNESLNARGVLSGGAQRPLSVASSPTQQVANSGTEIPGTNVSTDIISQQNQDFLRKAYMASGGTLGPYQAQAGAGAIGAANTLGGGSNQQMTDQFALQDNANQQSEQQAQNQNQAGYDNQILGSIAGAAGAAGNIAQGNAAGNTAGAIAASAQPGSIVNATPGMTTADNSPMTGAYNMPVNQSFFGGPKGTTIGTGSTPNYSFNSAPS